MVDSFHANLSRLRMKLLQNEWFGVAIGRRRCPLARSRNDGAGGPVDLLSVAIRAASHEPLVRADVEGQIVCDLDRVICKRCGNGLGGINLRKRLVVCRVTPGATARSSLQAVAKVPGDTRASRHVEHQGAGLAAKGRRPSRGLQTRRPPGTQNLGALDRPGPSCAGPVRRGGQWQKQFDLGYVWGGEAARLWAENPKFAYVIPKEGAHQFVDVMAIPQGAKNIEAAHRFLEYLLRPEVSKAISDEFPYTNPNGAARQLLTPEQRANPASYPPGDRKFGTFRHLGETGAMIDELITDLKNAR